MKKVAASDAKNRFGSLLEEAAVYGCVGIVKHGRVVGVLMSSKAFDDIQRSSSAQVDQRWSAAHMIEPSKARAARLIRKPVGFDE